MPTWYRPTEGRKGRVTFRSLDPAETMRNRKHAIAAFVTIIVFVLLQAIHYWSK
jgi:hypothetical protein